MKYHTTVSTVITTLLILCVFVAVSFFVVFELNIGSPGYLLLSTLEEKLEKSENYSITFSNIDRILKDRIQINDVKLKYNNLIDLEIDNVILYNNPLQLTKALFTKTGVLKGDINNIKVTINSSGKNSNSNINLQAVFEQIKNLEGYEDIFSKNFLYNYGYSINVSNLDLKFNEIAISGLRANIQLDEHLIFKSLVAEVPTYIDDKFNFEKIAFRSSNDGNIYSFAISGDKLSFIDENTNIILDQARASLEFNKFADLELTALPLNLSIDNTILNSDSVNLNIGPISVQNTFDGATYNISKIKAKYNNYDLTSSQISGSINVSEEYEANATIQIPEELTISNLDSEVKINGININASYLSSVSLDARVNEILLSNINNYSKNFIKDSKLNNLNIALQYNNSEAFIDASTLLLVGSDIAFLDNTKANASINAYITDKSLQELTVNLNEIKFPMIPYSAKMNFTHDDKNELDIYYQDKLSISFNDEQDILSGKINLSGFRGSDIKNAINTYSPFFNKYILDDTLINGNISFTTNKDKKGDIYSTLALDNIHFNDITFGIASGLNARIDEKGIEDIKFNITSELLRFAYLGSISFDTFLPEGSITVDYTKSGKSLLDLNISLGSNKQYDFFAKILNSDNGYIQGSINWAKEGLVQALGDVKSSASIYPFDLSLDINSKKIDLISDNLLLSADYSEQISVALSLDDFPLPVSDLSITPITINGYADYNFDFAEQRSLLTINDINIKDIRYIKSNPEITISGSYSNNLFTLDKIIYQDNISTLTGTLVIPIREKRMAFTLGDEIERLNISFKVINDNLYTGIVNLNDINIERFGFPKAYLNASLIGKGENINAFEFNGELNVQSLSNDKLPFTLSSQISINDKSVELLDLKFTLSDLMVSSPLIGYDTNVGNLLGNFDINYTRRNFDRDYLVTSSLDFDLNIGKYDSLSIAVLESFDKFQKEFDFKVNIDKINIDNFLSIDRRNIDVSFNRDNGFKIEGNMINGTFNQKTFDIDLNIDLLPVAALSIKGIANPKDLDLNLNDVIFNIGSINFVFPFPIIWFSDKAFVNGDLKIFGPLYDTHMYGNLYTKGFDMEVWWLQKSILRLSDIHFSMIDNYLSSPRTPILVIDKFGGPVKTVDVDLEAQLSPSNILDFFGLNVWIQKGQDVFVRIPIESQNMQIDADVYGLFSYYTDLVKNYLGGEIYSDSGVFSYGMDPLPSWWKSHMLVHNEFDVTLGENMKFLLPLSADPILVAYMKDKTHFTFKYDNQVGSISFDGSLDFRSGEIYYFEKNFYITEGSLSFNNVNSRRIAPVIDLTARLREFDSSGNKVDIYLILKNSTLTDLNPYFESSPHKDLNEIMTILGDAILPTNTYGEFNLSSVASLVTSGVDVMSRIGLINSTSSSTDLISTIRNSLNLDMFSLRTNLFENLVLDTIFTTTGQTISPVARYLDNTSIYLGKYINEDLFLQGMVHLSAFEQNSDKKRYTTILADDLQLDIEVSLEWSNPLGTFTFFTKPSNLSLFNIFDSFGFSYSKRILF